MGYSGEGVMSGVHPLREPQAQGPQRSYPAAGCRLQ
jgi:hypothetical protein